MTTGLTAAYVTKGPLGAHRNENEYYPTPAIATLTLVNNVKLPKAVWEPAAGRGHISKELIRNGVAVISSDLYKYDDPFTPVMTGVDFLKTDDNVRWGEGVITNPPFKSNLPEKLLRRTLIDLKYDFVALFVRLTFMESSRRYNLFKELPPSQILAFSERINCNEMYFDKNHGLGGMVAYAWYVWDYRNGRPDNTILNWVRPSDYIGELA